MIWKILAVGKPKLSFAAEGIAHYTQKILHYTQIETRFIRPTNSEKEGAELMQRSIGSQRIVLDERGSQQTSRQFAALIGQWETQSVRRVSLIIGNAEGNSALVRQSADLVLSLGKMTLQHELALLVALEQLYRAYTILRGLPYHRD